MFRPFRTVFIALGVSFITLASASAQTAIRCDVGGQVVYSDKPCPAGAAGNPVAPTQDTASQKAAAKQANAQLRADNAAIDKRMDDRLKRETVRPAKASKSESTGKKSKKSKQAAKQTMVSESSKSSRSKAGPASRNSKSKSGAISRPAGSKI